MCAICPAQAGHRNRRPVSCESVPESEGLLDTVIPSTAERLKGNPCCRSCGRGDLFFLLQRKSDPPAPQNQSYCRTQRTRCGAGDDSEWRADSLFLHKNRPHPSQLTTKQPSSSLPLQTARDLEAPPANNQRVQTPQYRPIPAISPAQPSHRSTRPTIARAKIE